MVFGTKVSGRRVNAIKTVLLSIILSVLLSGCITPGAYYAEEKVYRLAPQLGALSGRSLAHLFIPMVQVSPALDSPRITLFKPALQQDFLANGRWPDRLSTYFNATVIDTLSRSNAFLSVSDRPANNKMGYKLLLRLSGFHAESPLTPQGRVAVVLGMEALLMRVQDQRILGQYRYDSRKENIVANLDGIVGAMNQSLSESLTALITDMGNDLPAFY